MQQGEKTINERTIGKLKGELTKRGLVTQWAQSQNFI